MAIAYAEIGPWFDGVGGVEIQFGTEKAAELRIATVGSGLARRSGTGGAAARTVEGIEKVMGVCQPEEMVIDRQQERRSRFDRGGQARIVDIAPANKVHVAVKFVVRGKEIVEGLVLAVGWIVIA